MAIGGITTSYIHIIILLMSMANDEQSQYPMTYKLIKLFKTETHILE